MPAYIVCHKKRNNPRMDVRICELKCSLKDECKEFSAHHEISTPGETPSASSSGLPVKLEAA